MSEATRKTFSIEVQFGRANIKSLAFSDRVDATVSDWTEQLEKLKHLEPDGRQASKDFVLKCLIEDVLKVDPAMAEAVCAALVWLTATGAGGPSLIAETRQYVSGLRDLEEERRHL